MDGWLDLFSVNGHLEEEISKLQQSQQYRQPAQLFWNARDKGKNGFVVVPPEKAGSDLFQPIVGRGSAFADIEGDGDLDVVLTQIAGPPLLLRNEQKPGQSWLRLKLIGTRSNRDSIGARVALRSASRIWQAQVMPTRSYLSQCELPITFGFGQEKVPSEIEIHWPRGTVQKLPLSPEQRTLTVHEPKVTP